MKYSFDTIINRKNTGSIKYDFAARRGKPENVLPLWVADMDFQAPKEVADALAERSKHGIFGYTDSDHTYFTPLHAWYKNHFFWDTKEEWLTKTPGVVFAIACAVRAFTDPGDAVLIQQPVYYPFRETINNNNRKLVNNPLVYKDGKYSIDFEDFEKKIKDNHVRLFILCSPHNPVGRVWTPVELKKLADICLSYNVIIVSDEIHSDFVWGEHTHTVFSTLNDEVAENSIICTSPSKTFNLAGLQVSNIWIQNKKLRYAFRKEINRVGYSQLNSMGLIACEASYTYGRDWLDEVKIYIQENINFVREYLASHLPNVHLIEPEGTYLLWLDFSGLQLSDVEIEDRILNKAGLWLDNGDMFGIEGSFFQRINVACPRSIIVQAMEQLVSVF